MARGRIKIQKITNQTNRQVTYSKRRNGLLKKAEELSVLCDARVSIIMISSTGKLHEYYTPGTSQKELIDLYQKVKGVDLFESCYQKMKESLKKFKEVNAELRREIGLRMGEKEILNELSYEQVVSLTEEIESSIKPIRDRKYKVLSNQIETARKKTRNEDQQFNNYMAKLDGHYAQVEDEPHYGLVDNGEGFDGVPRIFSFRLP